MVYLLECLGFVINIDKSVLVLSQTIEFLGLTIDTINMELLLLLHKINMIQVESRKLLREGTTLVCALACLLGKMNAIACVIPPAPLFYCHLQMALANMLERNLQNYDSWVILLTTCLEDLNWWDTQMCKWNGNQSSRQRPT